MVRQGILNHFPSLGMGCNPQINIPWNVWQDERLWKYHAFVRPWNKTLCGYFDGVLHLTAILVGRHKNRMMFETNRYNWEKKCTSYFARHCFVKHKWFIECGLSGIKIF